MLSIRVAARCTCPSNKWGGLTGSDDGSDYGQDGQANGKEGHYIIAVIKWLIFMICEGAALLLRPYKIAGFEQGFWSGETDCQHFAKFVKNYLYIESRKSSSAVVLQRGVVLSPASGNLEWIFGRTCCEPILLL